VLVLVLVLVLVRIFGLHVHGYLSARA